MELPKQPEGRNAHPDCINSSNPYHECSDYCFKIIAGKKADVGEEVAEPATVDPDVAQLPTQFGKIRKRDPSYHSRYSKTVEVQEELKQAEPEVLKAPESDAKEDETLAEETNGDDDKEAAEISQVTEADLESMNPMQRRLFELRLKMNEARRANQGDIMAERKREHEPEQTRGISKQKWFEEKKRKIGKQLEAKGLDMSHAYMLDTQEEAEAKYKKWEKKETAFGWDIFNQQSLYRAYKKRTNNIEPDMDAYMKSKTTDPEFYREGSSLQYGQQVKDPKENVERMVRELEDRKSSRNDFSRRRRYHEEKDIDSINDRNEHFNRKIERAFGKFTVEIKNNLERGTALPD